MAKKIRQSELQALHDYRGKALQMLGSLSSIESRLARDAYVEPGPLRAEMVTTKSKRWSLEAVAEVIGADAAEKLYKALPLVVSSKLKIVSSAEQAPTDESKYALA